MTFSVLKEHLKKPLGNKMFSLQNCHENEISEWEILKSDKKYNCSPHPTPKVKEYQNTKVMPRPFLNCLGEVYAAMIEKNLLRCNDEVLLDNYDSADTNKPHPPTPCQCCCLNLLTNETGDPNIIQVEHGVGLRMEESVCGGRRGAVCFGFAVTV